MLTHPLPNLLENDSYFLAKDTLILLIPQMQHAMVSLLLNINKSNLIIEVCILRIFGLLMEPNQF